MLVERVADHASDNARLGDHGHWGRRRQCWQARRRWRQGLAAQGQNATANGQGALTAPSAVLTPAIVVVVGVNITVEPRPIIDVGGGGGENHDCRFIGRQNRGSDSKGIGGATEAGGGFTSDKLSTLASAGSSWAMPPLFTTMPLVDSLRCKQQGNRNGGVSVGGRGAFESFSCKVLRATSQGACIGAIKAASRAAAMIAVVLNI